MGKERSILPAALATFVCGAAVFATGCATSIPVRITKPAEIDLGNAMKVAVLPFGFPSQQSIPGMGPYQAALYRLWYGEEYEDKLERTVARHAESTVAAELSKTQYYAVLRTDDLRYSLMDGDFNAKIFADAVLSGRILTFRRDLQDRSATGNDGKRVERYLLTVTVETRFDAIRVSDKALVASKDFRGEASKEVASPAVADSAETLAKEIVSSQIASFVKSLAPYTVTEYRTLLADESKDERLARADKLAKDGFYRKAYDVYADIHRSEADFVAGYNAAIMAEVLGDLDGAIAAMEALADATSDARALRESVRMRATKRETERSADQLKR